MKKNLSFVVFYSIAFYSLSQNKALDDIITLKNTQRIIGTLAADDMKGRKVFSPEIDRAAAFIANEFKTAGLKPFGGNKGYLQSFQMVGALQTSVVAVVDGATIDSSKLFVYTSQPNLTIDQTSGYTIERINPGDNINAKVMAFVHGSQNTLVLVNDSQTSIFPRLLRLKQSMFPSNTSTVFMVAGKVPATFSIHATHTIKQLHLANVVGMLPGKSKNGEFVIFSGHYDHLGIKAGAIGDTIFNGANDDAAGTTAVIQLAKYYAAQRNNQRTIVFVAFTAEEVGGFGAQYFSKQFDPNKVAAMFNIEMIGTDSKWGNNAAYITGYEKTNMGQLMQKNLVGTGFEFYPDPYPTQHLFYRSDNATLARLGVPAHTISTSKMDAEPNYHKVSDEVSTLDLSNMNSIIKAIALSASSIISGADTPTRVNTNELSR